MGTEAAWMPAAMGAGSFLGGALGGGEPHADAEGYRGVLHPARLLQRGLGNLDLMGGMLTERARQPAFLPSSFVQQPPMFRGGGLPMSIGLSGRDPAISRPALLAAPGAAFPEPAAGSEAYPDAFTGLGSPKIPSADLQQGDRWMFPNAPRRRTGTSEREADFAGLRQPGGIRPQAFDWGALRSPGGMADDTKGMMAALEMLGVQADPAGNLQAPFRPGKDYPVAGPQATKVV
tara:strand:+ start:543 stop:1241 length:699 start_codon:yes stop_codon:yes gene_type:complete